MIRNHHWYALNSTRAYPLDDQATGTDDAGDRLPSWMLCDSHIRFPSTLGRYLFISSASVTHRLVTITFLAADWIETDVSSMSEAPAAFTPVAAITVPRDSLVPYRAYPVDAMAEGVGGWVTFGVMDDITYRGKFSTPEQSYLAPKCARSYDPLPIPSIGKLRRASTLQGVVELVAGTDVVIEGADREIDGVERRVIVVRLNDTDRTVYDRYKGPCGGRPEAGTCDSPGIEQISGVSPDCNGNIDIVVSGPCITTYPFQVEGVTRGGMALDICFDLADVCTQAKRLPDARGNLPDDYDDVCNPNLPIGESSSSLSSSSLSSVSSSIASVFCPDTFPYVEDFDDSAADNFEIQSGAFTFYVIDHEKELDNADDLVEQSSSWSLSSQSSACESIPSMWSLSSSSESLVEYEVPAHLQCRDVGYFTRHAALVTTLTNQLSYGPSSKSLRNVAVWNSCVMEDSVPFLVETHMRIPSQSNDQNGGLVLNYRLRATDGRPAYYTVDLNARTGDLEVRRFNGYVITDPPIATVPIGVVTDRWYALRVVLNPPVDKTAAEGSALGNARITMTVWRVSDGIRLTSATLTISDGTFGPYTGLHGIGSRKSEAQFSFLRFNDSNVLLGDIV